MKKFSMVISLAVVAATVLTMSGCLKFTSNILEVTSPAVPQQPATSPYENPYQNYNPVMPTTNPITEFTTAAPETPATLPVVPEFTTVAPVTPTAPISQQPQQEQTTAAPKDPSSWTKDEIITFITNAVNKTKAYTGGITAAHKESMQATVTDCPGGSTVKSIVNKVVEGALEDTDETLQFSGGKATSSEGETLQLLLPKAGAFSLPTAGVASASASKNGNIVTVRIQLVPEKGSLSAPPAVHATTMGYLDIGSLDLSGIDITSFDTDYPGSQMEFTVDTSTGYVKTAVYTISLTITASGKAAFITANVGVSAKETESWTINW